MDQNAIHQHKDSSEDLRNHDLAQDRASATTSGSRVGKEEYRLTWSDYGNLIMLYVFCFCQGIPTGLAGATIPATFKVFLPYGTVGLFSLTALPYCFKLVWAPIIDFYWNAQVGRRMTWILPTQLLSGMMLIIAGVWTKLSFENVEESSKIRYETLYISVWLLVCLLGAIQSCVLDGWSVELLGREKSHWVGSVHTLGSISGNFTAYTFFMLVFKDRLVHVQEAASLLSTFISCWGIFFLAVAAALPLVKREHHASLAARYRLREAYGVILSICRIRPVQRTIIVHLLARLAFEVNDGATDLKFLDQGMSNSTLALLVLLVMPFDLASAYIAGYLSRIYKPLNVWQLAYAMRLLSAAIAAVVVAILPTGPPSLFYLSAIYLQRVLSVVTGTIMFTTFLQFHLRIADPIASGTYMTVLATAQNIGGILPRLAIMKLIDVSTISRCQPIGTNMLSEQLTCNTPQQKTTCVQMGGACNTISDGYFVTGGICLFLGSCIFLFYLRPTVERLKAVPTAEWLLGHHR